MTEAVIVSTARTPIGKAFRGAFNLTHGGTMAGHVIKHAVARAKLAPEEIEDVILGCGFPEGAAGHNLGRIAAIRAGLPVTTSGTTINRFCSSGMQAISTAAQRVIVDGVTVPMINVMDNGATILVDTDGVKPRTWEEQYKRKRSSLLVGQYDLHKTNANKNDTFEDDPIDKEGLWVIDSKGNLTRH